jgi:hypothetical protein
MSVARQCPKCVCLNPNGIEINQPRVARNELPWVDSSTKGSTLKGLAANVRQSHTLFVKFDFIPLQQLAEPDLVQPFQD